MTKFELGVAKTAKLLVADLTIELAILDIPHALAVGCWALSQAELFEH
jgi:hypothetical protein